MRAAPPPELSPELDLVPWPEESQQPLTKPVHRRPLLIAAAIATAVGGGFILGQATAPSSTSLSTERVVRLAGTTLDRNATGTLKLGRADADGNWPMDLHIKRTDRAPEGRLLRPLPDEGRQARRPLRHVQLNGGEATIRMNAAYDLSQFDKNGWVVTRQPSGHFKPDQIVLKPRLGRDAVRRDEGRVRDRHLRGEERARRRRRSA